MGDFNIDLAQENDSSLTFRNMLLSNSFYNTIDKPTRITSRSVSLIDIFSNIHRDTYFLEFFIVTYLIIFQFF